jgi:hypothetical protein
MARTSIPHDLDQRLQVVWQQLGHLLDWCGSSTAWMQLFCAEARPYRETFYWEAVARMMSEYLTEHQTESPEDVLTDCLIATQCPPSSDDRDALTEFHNMWQEILIDSQQEIDTVMQRDLELAQQEGTHETVAALYAADHQAWQQG